MTFQYNQYSITKVLSHYHQCMFINVLNTLKAEICYIFLTQCHFFENLLTWYDKWQKNIWCDNFQNLIERQIFIDEYSIFQYRYSIYLYHVMHHIDIKIHVYKTFSGYFYLKYSNRKSLIRTCNEILRQNFYSITSGYTGSQI